MSRRLALLAAVPLATLAAAAPAAGAPASSPPRTAVPAPSTAQDIFLDYGDLESLPSTSVVVLIGANDYGLVPRPA
jgi:hypothetical protein